MIVGEGYERARLEAHRRALGAQGWLELPGYKEEQELLDLYRRAWVVASTSQREGWGMTISEAGACATRRWCHASPGMSTPSRTG